MLKNSQFIEVKKFALKFIFLCCILVIADFIIGKTLNHYYFKIKSGSLYDITFAVDSTNAQTLVFGSSRANHHYVPDIFENQLNTTFYNCGSDGTGLIYEAAMIKAVTMRYKPKRILVDIQPGEFSFDESDRLSKLLPYHSNSAIYPYILDMSPYERLKLLSQSYPFNSLVTSIITRSLIKIKEIPNTKGYLRLDGTIDNVKPLVSTEEGKIIQKKVIVYENLLEYLNQLNINTYIIISPFYAQFGPNKSEKITKNIHQKYKNIHFISFLNRVDYLDNYKLFKDFAHLNNNGSIKFSNELCRFIIATETKERNKRIK